MKMGARALDANESHYRPLAWRKLLYKRTGKLLQFVTINACIQAPELP